MLIHGECLSRVRFYFSQEVALKAKCRLHDYLETINSEQGTSTHTDFETMRSDVTNRGVGQEVGPSR